MPQSIQSNFNNFIYSRPKATKDQGSLAIRSFNYYEENIHAIHIYQINILIRCQYLIY